MKMCPDGITEVYRDNTKKDCPFQECPKKCVCGESCKIPGGYEGVC
jgi:hypothetical protein